MSFEERLYQLRRERGISQEEIDQFLAIAEKLKQNLI